MTSYPLTVSIYLRRSQKAGLFAAVSADLPGLMTIANNIEEVERRLPAAIKQLIKAEYNADVEVILAPPEDGDDFVSLSEPKIVELRAA